MTEQTPADELVDHVALEIGIGMRFQSSTREIAHRALAAVRAHDPASITPEELEEIEVLVAGITPGPWSYPGTYGDFGWTVRGPAGGVETEDSEQGKADAAFIGQAPEMVRRLVAAYRELSARSAVEICTRQDRIAELEGALRAAIEQRDSARAHRDRLNAAWLRADAALSDQGRAVVDSTGDLASAIESDTTALRSEVVRLRAERDEALNQRWSDDDAPGGYVCAICGVTVESEPCPKHSPAGLRARLKRARRGRREARQQVRALEETLVCAICGVTVESEPCPEHSPDGLRARLEHARRTRREARKQVRALTFERDRLRLAWESARRGRREARKRTGPTRPSRAEMTPAKRTALETIGRPLRTDGGGPS